MSSFSETVDTEVTVSVTCASVCMCAVNETAGLCHDSFINRDAEHAGFIFKVFLRLNIYRY